MSIFTNCLLVSDFMSKVLKFQMKTFSQYQKLLVGVGALTGAAVYYFNGADKRQAFSSWTTNYTLSSSYAKWDENWDQ